MVRRINSLENVYGVDMSYVIWYSGLEAVLNGTVSGGCGAVSVFSLIPVCYARVVVCSGLVVSSKLPPARVMP